MRIKQIAHNHIEVTVTEGDLLLFDMNMDSMTPDSPNLRTFLFKVLEKVKSETGMDMRSGQVFVEAKRNDDTLVFTIKRMGLTKEEKRKKYKNARAVVKPLVEKVYIYGFERFDDMAAALGNIDNDMLGCAAVYIFEDMYYCSFRTERTFDKYDGVLSEFCKVNDEYEFTEAILNEHGKCIAKGESVVSLIEGIKKYGL